MEGKWISTSDKLSAIATGEEIEIAIIALLSPPPKLPTIKKIYAKIKAIVIFIIANSFDSVDMLEFIQNIKSNKPPII